MYGYDVGIRLLPCEEVFGDIVLSEKRYTEDEFKQLLFKLIWDEYYLTWKEIYTRRTQKMDKTKREEDILYYKYTQ